MAAPAAIERGPFSYDSYTLTSTTANDVPGGQEAGRVTYRSSDDPQEACFRDLLGHAVDDR